MPYLFKTLPAVIAMLCASAHAATFDNIVVQYLTNSQLSDKVQVIDCRSSNQYNGWPSKETIRGGHFPGAINLDSQWLTLLEHTELQQLVTAKRLYKNKPTFLYCDDNASQSLGIALKQQGFENVNVITESLNKSTGKLISLPTLRS